MNTDSQEEELLAQGRLYVDDHNGTCGFYRYENHPCMVTTCFLSFDLVWVTCLESLVPQPRLNMDMLTCPISKVRFSFEALFKFSV